MTAEQACNDCVDSDCRVRGCVRAELPLLNRLSTECHAANQHWWHDPATGKRLDRNKGELLMLIVSELAEAMEGERKNLMDDKLSHRKMAEVELADALIRLFDYCGAYGIDLDSGANLRGETLNDMACDAYTLYGTIDNKGEALLSMVRFVVRVYERPWAHVQNATEFGGFLHRLFAYAFQHGYDLDGAVAEKRAFNAVRPDHKAEARLGPNGKKF